MVESVRQSLYPDAMLILITSHDIVCELLKYKEVDANAKTVGGETVQVLAIRNGHVDVVRVLQEH